MWEEEKDEGGGRGAAAHCSLMESGGSRNYFRAAIRRTKIHFVVVKQSLPLSPEGFESWEENGGGNEGGHTRERTLSRHAVSGVIDPVLRSPDLCPPHARRQAGPPSLPSGKRRDKVSFLLVKP